jgi:hypothetical protein
VPCISLGKYLFPFGTYSILESWAYCLTRALLKYLPYDNKIKKELYNDFLANQYFWPYNFFDMIIESIFPNVKIDFSSDEYFLLISIISIYSLNVNLNGMLEGNDYLTNIDNHSGYRLLRLIALFHVNLRKSDDLSQILETIVGLILYTDNPLDKGLIIARDFDPLNSYINDAHSLLEKEFSIGDRKIENNVEFVLNAYKKMHHDTIDHFNNNPQVFYNVLVWQNETYGNLILRRPPLNFYIHLTENGNKSIKISTFIDKPEDFFKWLIWYLNIHIVDTIKVKGTIKCPICEKYRKEIGTINCDNVSKYNEDLIPCQFIQPFKCLFRYVLKTLLWPTGVFTSPPKYEIKTSIHY